ALSQQGKADEAIASYRKAIALDPKNAEAHCNLGHLLGMQGRLAESLVLLRRGHALGSKRINWPYPSALWVRRAERLVVQEEQLVEVLSGKRVPASGAEWISYANLSTLIRRYAAGARLYADGFTTDAALADNLPAGHRYHAARAAAMAACGKGKD